LAERVLVGVGYVGIGLDVPTEKLHVQGNIRCSGILEHSRFYSSPYDLADLSPDVWAHAGDANAKTGGGSITSSSGVTIRRMNGIPMWFFNNRDCYVDINNTISTGDVFTIAICIAKKPESGGILFTQLSSTSSDQTNHMITYDGKIRTDEFPPSGGGSATSNFLNIQDESVLVIRKSSNAIDGLQINYNGCLFENDRLNETFRGNTPSFIRLGMRGRFSGYVGNTAQNMGISAIACWSSYVSDANLKKYLTYQSITQG
jgi:hypothetical protein